MERFESLAGFYRRYETVRGNILIEDVERLEERLRLSGHSVRELKDGRVIVRAPAEIAAARERRRGMQQAEAAKYTKRGAAIPRETARRFAGACRALGVSQSEILLPLIETTISRAAPSTRGSCQS
jgi:hypothetical protein